MFFSRHTTKWITTSQPFRCIVRFKMQLLNVFNLKCTKIYLNDISFEFYNYKCLYFFLSILIYTILIFFFLNVSFSNIMCSYFLVTKSWILKRRSIFIKYKQFFQVYIVALYYDQFKINRYIQKIYRKSVLNIKIIKFILKMKHKLGGNIMLLMSNDFFIGFRLFLAIIRI